MTGIKNNNDIIQDLNDYTIFCLYETWATILPPLPNQLSKYSYVISPATKTAQRGKNKGVSMFL